VSVSNSRLSQCAHGHEEPLPVEAVPMCLTTNKRSLTRVLQNHGAQCGAATKLSLAKADHLPRIRTMLCMWSDGLAPLSESLVAIDATKCTNTSSGLDVHVLNGVAFIERGVGTAVPHKSAHHCKIVIYPHGLYIRIHNSINVCMHNMRMARWSTIGFDIGSV
jgi:hypothetical protein